MFGGGIEVGDSQPDQNDHHDGSPQPESVRSPSASDSIAFGGEDDRAPGSAADGLLGWDSALKGPGSTLMPGSRRRPRRRRPSPSTRVHRHADASMARACDGGRDR